MICRLATWVFDLFFPTDDDGDYDPVPRTHQKPKP